jgi:hypothetical protein
MAGHFDICREMAKRGMDIRMSLLENVTNLSYSKRTKGTTVSIGIDGNLVGAIFNNKFVGGLLLCDREQYFAIKKELGRCLDLPKRSRRMKTEAQTLQEKQLDAEQAWEYLQSKNVPNLDIERPGLSKVTLVELLAEFANGVFVGKAERIIEAEERLTGLMHDSSCGCPDCAKWNINETFFHPNRFANVGVPTPSDRSAEERREFEEWADSMMLGSGTNREAARIAWQAGREELLELLRKKAEEFRAIGWHHSAQDLEEIWQHEVKQ